MFNLYLKLFCVLKLMINSNFKKQIINEDIIIIDNFYKNPKEMVKLAYDNENNFGTHESIYQNKVFNPKFYFNDSAELINFFEKVLGKKIYQDEWDLGVDDFSNGWIQFNKSDLKPLIHSDNMESLKTNWGGVVFFTDNENSGTGFYEHLATGFKKRPEDKYLLTLENEKLEELLSYIKNDANETQESKKFKMYYNCPSVYNRLVLFNAALFHCGLNSYGDNVKNSRLFQTFFIRAVDNL